MDQEKLQEILNKLQGKVPMDKELSVFLRELFVTFPELLDFLDKNYSSSKEHLEEEKGSHPPTPWEILGLRFYLLSKIDRVFLDLSRVIYEHWYSHQIRFELNKKERTIHKGTPVHQLGLIWQEKNDLEKARKYFLLGLIEDILESLRVANRNAKKQQGFRVLKSSYYFTENQYKFVYEIATKFEDKRFPEEILRQCLKGPERIPTWEEISNENLDKDYLKNIYSNIKGAPNEAQAFEEFVEKLLGAVRGFFVIPGVKLAMTSTKKKEHDYDRLIRNRSVLLSDFGTYVLVECKYWDEKVGYDEISKFIYKTITRRCRSGILFAKSGVKDKKYNQTIRDAYLAHDTAIIVIAERDIKDILSCKKNFISLLVDKYEEVRFHTS